jgi:uncharacterized protein
MERHPHEARFRFEGRLADLVKQDADGVRHYHFGGTPSLKDAIEAMGVPHVEAGTLLLNGESAGNDSLLHNTDSVTVHPDNAPFPEARFVLDVHLGSLTRALRLLGFDCAYRNDYNDHRIVDIAVAEGRAVLTRDLGLLKHKRVERGYWLRSQHTEAQVHEVLQRFSLSGAIQPFRRCLDCNGIIHPVREGEVSDQIPESVLGFRQEYFRCEGCGKVYWKGTHYDRMQAFVNRIVQCDTDYDL